MFRNAVAHCNVLGWLPFCLVPSTYDSLDKKRIVATFYALNICHGHRLTRIHTEINIKLSFIYLKCPTVFLLFSNIHCYLIE